jgi:hypothetical protein
VLYGLVCTDLDEAGAVRDWIFCYRNFCRTAVLEGLINFPATASDQERCVDCNVKLSARSVVDAMLTTDLAPNSFGEQRMLSFCYVNNSRNRLLANATL